MTERERELLLKCYNSCEQALPILHGLYQFKFADYIYSYLIRHGIVGNNLVELYKKYDSPLSLYKYISSKISLENRKIKINELRG